MADKSRIEWTEATWNPLTGCTKIGQGCVNCYAERMARRLKAMGQLRYQNVVSDAGRWSNKVELVAEALEMPLKWKRPRRIFVNSMSDLFHKDVPVSFIGEVFDVMNRANWHTYQILTKRYERPLLTLGTIKPEEHILLGVSVCTQQDAEQAWPFVSGLARLGWRTWVSYEPALEKIDWRGWEFIDWLVCGGESGPGARPMQADWAESALNFAQGNQIPFLFKQWGGRIKATSGRNLGGREWNDYPPVPKRA